MSNLEEIIDIHKPSSDDWNSIPSELGARLLSYLMKRTEIYHRQGPWDEDDVRSLSASGPFGGALSMILGGNCGAQEWRNNWKGNSDAMRILLGFAARKTATFSVTNADVTPEIMRDLEIARGLIITRAFERWGGSSPFSVLEAHDYLQMQQQDARTVAMIATSDSGSLKKILNAIPEDECGDFMREIAEIFKDNHTNPVDAISQIGQYVSPADQKGQTFMDYMVEQIGARWATKADRTLRTAEVLSRHNEVWEYGQYPTGWLRIALNHCTKETPDRLVQWIGQAPCLYEFLNTAAKQRRGVIAARRLIRMSRA
jgi:hypothetical protein